MDLGFTDEQEMLREAVRDLCRTHATTDQLRELEDDPVGFRPELWRALAQMDLLGLSLPVEHGGSGMGNVETAILHEELGAALAPSPHLVSVVLAGGVLSAAGTDEQRERWLAPMARGEAIVTVAWYEPGRGDQEGSIALTATSAGDRVRLDGTKILVPFARSADATLTLARGEHGVELYLVPGDAEGLHAQHTETLASDASFELRYDGVEVGPDDRVGDPGQGWAIFTRAMDPALVALAASAVGGAQRAQDMAVDYANHRVQFGVPIGSFQGLAHPLADRATEIEGARVLTYEAAWVLDGYGDAGPLPAMAKQNAAEVFRRTGRLGHQVFGGIGFTREIDMQLYFRRAKQAELQWFGAASLLERVAAAELDADDPFVGPDPGWRDGQPHPVV